MAEEVAEKVAEEAAEAAETEVAAEAMVVAAEEVAIAAAAVAEPMLEVEPAVEPAVETEAVEVGDKGAATVRTTRGDFPALVEGSCVRSHIGSLIEQSAPIHPDSHRQ